MTSSWLDYSSGTQGGIGAADIERARQNGVPESLIKAELERAKASGIPVGSKAIDAVNNPPSSTPSRVFPQRTSVRSGIDVLFLNNLGRFPTSHESSKYQSLYNRRSGGYERVENEIIEDYLYRNENITLNAYRTFLGRDPSPEEAKRDIAPRLGLNYRGENNTKKFIKSIASSKEADDFKNALADYADAYALNGDDSKLREINFYGRIANYNDPALSLGTFSDNNYVATLRYWNTKGKQNGDVIVSDQVPLIQTVDGELKLADDKYFGVGAKEKFQNIVNKIKTSPGGNYKELIENIINNSGLDVAAAYSLTDKGGLYELGNYYLDNKVNAWDPTKQGAQPPVGGFNAKYYAEQAPEATKAWNNLQTGFTVNGKQYQDLDIIGRYNYETYLHQHYTNVGRYKNIRGNPEVTPKEAEEYKEQLTDSELQYYRDNVLGLGQDEKTIDWENENIGLLEAQTLKTLSQRDAQAQQTFGALTQDVLKQATQKLLEEKKKESTLALFRGLPGYDEVFSVNKTLANSLLGDTGIGGILSMTQGSDKTQESLEKQISQFTGISSNSTLYNWQQWFDDTLIKRYEEMTEVMSPEDASKMLKVEQGFAQSFIDEYLKPRFDQSKSMDEFISYIDVKEEEQNVFQTQDAINALKDVANVRAKLFYDQIKSASGGVFDADFYFDPTVDANDVKAALYQKQKDKVAKDWKDAKNNGDSVKVGEYTWNQWAYYYGLDPKNKEDFAKLHYQVKGLGEGFDPAADIVTINDAQDYINTVVVPAVEKANLEIGEQPFLQFKTPEEFADELLEGISPEENQEEWQKVLKMYGLDSASASLDEVKDYIIEAVRTNQAQSIRESIKYLNEKKLKPTQERLGVSYIERPEDEREADNKEETALYSIFKSAGYAGNEDDFYNEFMPDTSKEEQQAIAKAMSGDLGLKEIDTSDPFAALSNLSGFLGQDEDLFGSAIDDSTKIEEDAPTTSSYFRLFEDDEAEPTKSNAAESYISEFTSLFKGFK